MDYNLVLIRVHLHHDDFYLFWQLSTQVCSVTIKNAVVNPCLYNTNNKRWVGGKEGTEVINYWESTACIKIKSVYEIQLTTRQTVRV